MAAGATCNQASWCVHRRRHDHGTSQCRQHVCLCVLKLSAVALFNMAPGMKAACMPRCGSQAGTACNRLAASGLYSFVFHHLFKHLMTSSSVLRLCAGAAPFIALRRAVRPLALLMLMAGTDAGQATPSASKQAAMWLRVWS